MSDEQDGLPPGWAWASMSDLTSYVTSGSRDWSEFYSDAGALFIRTQDINTNTLRWKESAFVHLPEQVEGKRSLVERGDILITITGANVGKCALVEEDIPEAYVSQSVALVKLVDAEFGPALRLACLRPLRDGQTVLQKLAYGLGRPVLSLKQIRELELPFPPLNEQKRIVGKIEALQARADAAREALDAIPPLLEKFRQSVLAAAFRGDLTRKWREAHPDVEPASALLDRIRAERRRKWEQANPRKKYVEPEPADASGLPELPEGWCWATSAELVEPGTTITYGVVQPGPHHPDGVPYVRGLDVQDGTILVDQLLRMAPALAATKPNSALVEGDVVLCIIRHLRVAVVPSGMDGANLTQGAVRMRPSFALRGDYLAGWLESPVCQAWMKALHFGIAMPRINVEDTRRIPVPLAPVAEQTAIARSLACHQSRYVDGAGALERARTAYAALNQAVLAKAFRGELVPQDPDDEPASVLLERIRREREAAAAAPKAGRRRKAGTAP